jgi:hypothetical protein
MYDHEVCPPTLFVPSLPLWTSGVTVDVTAERGKVTVEKWLEGDVTVRAGRLTAKMVKGHRVRMLVRGREGEREAGRAEPGEVGREGEAPLTVEALYGKDAAILCTAEPEPASPLHREMEGGKGGRGGGEGEGTAVCIGRAHGALKVVATKGGVRLGGVNGSAVVQTGGGDREGGRAGGIDVRFEGLEPGQTNVLATQGGPVNLLVVRQSNPPFSLYPILLCAAV